MSIISKNQKVYDMTVEKRGLDPMKKINTVITLLFALLLLVSMTGCGCDHQYQSEVVKEATCAENGEIKYTCTLCGKSYTEKTEKNDNHSYTSSVTKGATVTSTGVRTYTCSRCGHSYTETIEKIKGNWVKDYYVDDFGDKTGSAYVRGEFKGTFSNSATSGSTLTVYIFLDPSYPSATTIRLLEYGSYKATFTSSTTITLKTKDSSGNTKSYTLTYSSGDLYSFDSGLANAIRNNKELSILITTSSKYQSVPDTYTFKVDNIGLSDLMK